jgi:hypothetical protein
MQRIIGTMADLKKLKENLQVIRRSGVGIKDVKDALFSPQSVGKRVIKENGKPSVRYTGLRCNVSVNPDSGVLIQTNPRKG